MMAKNRTLEISFLSTTYPWIVVLCGMSFYFFNYFLRVSPSVMQPELTQAFHINAYQFGTLAAFYYYAYTPMQIPAGLLYDKFGVRIVLSTACLFATIGLGIFIQAHTYPMACFGRFLIGMGCAFAYIGTLKLASLWLPSSRFGLIACVTTAVGMLSGVGSQKYLSRLVETLGYKGALHSVFYVGLVLCVLLYIFIRNRLKSVDIAHLSIPENPMNLKQLLLALKVILTNKQMWIIGLIGCLLYLPSSVLLDLWGIPYLETVYHISSTQAATIQSYLFYGWIISGPVIGIFSDKIRKRKIIITVLGSCTALLLLTLLYVPSLSPNSIGVILFIMGFCCGAQPLCFALGKESNPIAVSGTSVAITNMLIMLGGVIFQPVVGMLLDWHTTSPLGSNGLPTYSGIDYQYALSVIPIGVIIAVILSFFLKETYGKSPVEEKIKPTNELGKLRPQVEVDYK